MNALTPLLLLLLATIFFCGSRAMRLDMEELLKNSEYEEEPMMNMQDEHMMLHEEPDAGGRGNRRQRRSNGLVQAILMLHKSVLQTQNILSEAITSVLEDQAVAKDLFSKEVASVRDGVKSLQVEVAGEIAAVKDMVTSKVDGLTQGQDALQKGLAAEVASVNDGLKTLQGEVAGEIAGVKDMVTSNVASLKEEGIALNQKVTEGIANVNELVNTEVVSLKAGQGALKAQVGESAASIQVVKQAVDRNIVQLKQGQANLFGNVGKLNIGFGRLVSHVQGLQKGFATDMASVKGLITMQAASIKQGQTKVLNKVKADVAIVKAVLNAFGNQLVNVREEMKDTKEELSKGIEGVRSGQTALKIETAATVKATVAKAADALNAEISLAKDAYGALSTSVQGVAAEVEAVKGGQTALKNSMNSQFTAVQTASKDIHAAQSTLNALVQSEIAGVKAGQTTIKEDMDGALTLMQNKLSSDTLEVQTGQNELKKLLLEEIETLKSNQDSLSTALTSKAEESKVEEKELKIEIKDVLTASKNQVSTGFNAMKEAQNEMQLAMTKELFGVADMLNSGVHGVSSKLDNAMDAITAGNAALTGALTTATEAQTAVLTAKQAAIAKEVSVIQNLLTKETSRFPDPQFGEDTVDGVTKYYVQGHIEVLHDGEWGTICENGITDNEAEVLCKMGGYRGGVYNGGAYKQPTAPKAAKVWLDNLVCANTDVTHIEKCTHNPWGDHTCTHYSDIGIRCFY